jgi:hypothetical protein
LNKLKNSAICITAGEQSENHVGMEINGEGLSASGFTIQELNNFKQILLEKGIESEYHRLDETLEDSNGVEPAALLIIRDGISKLIEESATNMLEEQLSFEWDKKFWDTRRKKVFNKIARYNVCYGEVEQEPDYENKKGTIKAYDSVPILNKWRNSLGIIFGKKQQIWR